MLGIKLIFKQAEHDTVCAYTVQFSKTRVHIDNEGREFGGTSMVFC